MTFSELDAGETLALVCAFDWAMTRLFYDDNERGKRHPRCSAVAVRAAQLEFYRAAQALGGAGVGRLLAKVSAAASEAGRRPARRSA